jgi:hypothetical protein
LRLSSGFRVLLPPKCGSPSSPHWLILDGISSPSKDLQARAGMLPSNTDTAVLSKLTQLSGEYLPKIAGAPEAERKKLLCELVRQIFDVWTERRTALIHSLEEPSGFRKRIAIALVARRNAAVGIHSVE